MGKKTRAWTSRCTAKKATRWKTNRDKKQMVKIEAIVQPHKSEDVRNALKAIGVDGMSVSEVRGHGRQKGHKEVYRGREYIVDLVPKVKIEMVIPPGRTEEVISTIMAAARTGKIGDG